MEATEEAAPPLQTRSPSAELRPPAVDGQLDRQTYRYHMQVDAVSQHWPALSTHSTVLARYDENDTDGTRLPTEGKAVEVTD